MNATTCHSTQRNGFAGSSELGESLQRVLVDLIALHLNGKQAHWNVVGPNFRGLHLQLDDLVDETREHSDAVAERMRALYTVPDGRPVVVSDTTALPTLPPGVQNGSDVVDAVTDLIGAAVATIRHVHDRVDAADPTTADLLHTVIESLEKQAWMLSAENAKA